MRGLEGDGVREVKVSRSVEVSRGQGEGPEAGDQQHKESPNRPGTRPADGRLSAAQRADDAAHGDQAP